MGVEDINALGGWPITRDYYGYMTHALNSLGAKVIAFYILFDTPDPRFPEYDEVLASFLQNSGSRDLRQLRRYNFGESSK